MNTTVNAINDLVDPTSIKDISMLICAIQSVIQSENETIAAARDSIKELNEELETLKIEETRLQREETHRLNLEEGRKWKAEHPEEYETFWAMIQKRNEEGLVEGARLGWWDLDENGEMLAPAKVFKLSDFTDVNTPLLAHVMAKAGIFPSIGQARKNGWDKPLTIGEWCVTKKKIRIRVEK